MIDKLDLMSRRYDELTDLLARPEIISDLPRLQE